MTLPSSGAISIGDLRTEFYSGRSSAQITCVQTGDNLEERLRNGYMSGHIAGSTEIAGNLVRGKAKPEFFSMVVSAEDGDKVDEGMAIYAHDDTGFGILNRGQGFGGQFSDEKTPYKNIAVGAQLITKYRIGYQNTSGNWVLVFTMPTIAHNFEYSLPTTIPNSANDVVTSVDILSTTVDRETGVESVETKNLIPTRTGAGTWDIWGWVRGKSFTLGPPRELEHFVRRTETANAYLCLWDDDNNIPSMLTSSQVGMHSNIPNSFILPGGNTDDMPAYGSTGLSLSDYRGQGENLTFIIDQTYLELNLFDWAVAEGWNQITPLTVTIREKDSSDNDIWLYSDDTTKGGLIIDGDFPSSQPVTIINNGKIAGKGGDGNSNNGGPALQILSGGPTSLSIINNSTGFIAGGGGGGASTFGGGGAGGGTGAGNNPNLPNRGTPGEIGEAGAFGDACGGRGGNTQNGTPGAGGGRILSSAFNTPGGSNVENTAGNGATGGGAWGKAASFGGSGGQPITQATGTTITLTDNGTIYGPDPAPVVGDIPPVPFWNFPDQTLINGSTWTKPSSIGNDDWVVFYLIGGGAGNNSAGGDSFGGAGGAYLIAVRGDEVPSTVNYSIGSAGISGFDGNIGGNQAGNVTDGEDTSITLTPGGTSFNFIAQGGAEAIGTTQEIPNQFEPAFNTGGTGGPGRLYWRDSSGTVTNALAFTNISSQSVLQLPNGSNSPTLLRGGEGGATEGPQYGSSSIGNLPGGNSDWGGAGFSEFSTTGVSTFGNAGGSAENGNIRIYWNFTPPVNLTLDTTDGNFRIGTELATIVDTQTITTGMVPATGEDEWRINYNQSQGGGAYIRIFYEENLVYTGSLIATSAAEGITELTVNVDGTDITFVRGTQFRVDVSSNTDAVIERGYAISRDVTSFTPTRTGRAAIVALGAGGSGACRLVRVDGRQNENAAWGGGAGGMAVAFMNVTTSMTFSCSIGVGGSAKFLETDGDSFLASNGDAGTDTLASGNGVALKGYGGAAGVHAQVQSSGGESRTVLGGIAEGGTYNIQGGQAGDEPGVLIGTHGGSPAQPDYREFQGYATQQLSLPSDFESGHLGVITGTGGAGGKSINGSVPAGSGGIYGAGGGGFARSSREANISGTSGAGSDGVVYIVYFD